MRRSVNIKGRKSEVEEVCPWQRKRGRESDGDERREEEIEREGKGESERGTVSLALCIHPNRRLVPQFPVDCTLTPRVRL